MHSRNMRNTSDLPGSGTLSEEIMRKRHLKRRHRRGVRILRTLLLLILAGMIAVLATGPSGDIRSIKRLFATVTDRTGTTKPGTTSSDANSPTTSTRSTATTTTHPASTAPDAVGVRQFTFVDHSRLIYPPHTATGHLEHPGW